MKSTAHQGDQLTHVSGVWENPTLRLGFVPGRRMSSWQGWVPQLVMTLRSNLRSAGVEIVIDKSKTVDAVWVHEDQVSDSMLSGTCPLLVHSVSDVAQLYNRTRQLLAHPTVAAVTVQHAYRPRAIYNSREFSLGFHNTLFRECRPDLFPAEPGVSFKPLNPHQIDRIRVTFGYGAFRRLESLRQKPAVIEHHRDVDVHFAGTTRYRSPLVTQHRRLCVESIRQLRDRHRVVCHAGPLLSMQQYWASLLRSRICVSPWGWGAACHRDAEAILAGCVLVKPYTDFIDTWPDLYRAGETYICCRPDFGDLDSIVESILSRWDDFESFREINRQRLLDECDPWRLTHRFARLVREAIRPLPLFPNTPVE